MIIRRRRTRNFTVLENEVVEDSRLSLDEIGLLVWFRSRPDNWEVSRLAVQKRFGIGRDKCDRIFRGLLGAGWMVREDVRDEGGGFSHPRYIVLDEPGREVEVAENEFSPSKSETEESVASLPQPENPLPENPLPENPATVIRTEVNNTTPPTPPSGGRSNADEAKHQDSLAKFAAAFPAPIVDYARTAKLWASLTDADRAAATRGAKAYAAYLAELAAKKRSRNVKDAHRWLAARQWLGFVHGPPAENETAAQRFDAVEGSAEWNAWAAYYRCCGHADIATALPGFRIRRDVDNGRIANVPAQWPPDIGGGGGEWFHAVEGTAQFAAWLRRLRELPGAPIGLRNLRVAGKPVRGLTVPSEWPPRKSLAADSPNRAATGPPFVAGTLMTEEDEKALAELWG